MPPYKIFKIERKDGLIGVDYEVTPENSPAERCFIRRSDIPHEDFVEAFAPLYEMAKRFIEIPLVIDDSTLLMSIRTVRFLQSKSLGNGISMTIELEGLPHAINTFKITTPKYFEIAAGAKLNRKGEAMPCQLLSPAEMEVIELLKEEAFKYAYFNKRQQPTVDEAQEAAENGGFRDELVANEIKQLPVGQ